MRAFVVSVAISGVVGLAFGLLSGRSELAVAGAAVGVLIASLASVTGRASTTEESERTSPHGR